MTTASDEFMDLMPHQIKVTGATEYNDYGRPIGNAIERNYRCLIDDATTVVRSADGVTVTVALTAYVAPVPMESADNEPVDILPNESVEIISPSEKAGVKTIQSAERHYDSELGIGKLHNIVLRLA